MLYYSGQKGRVGMKQKKQTHALTSRQQKWLVIAVIVIAAAAIALISVFVGIPLVEFASEPEKFRAWIDETGIWGRLAFIGMTILQIVIALLPGEPFELAAGYAFGAVEGMLLCILASTLGSMLVFWLVRTYGVRLVEVFYSEEKLRSVKFLKTSSKRDFLFLVIFMIPGTPKDLLCYFAGLTDMPASLWLMICSLGRLPSIVTSTVGGSALGSQNYTAAIIVFAVTLLVSGLGLLAYDRICKRHTQKESEKDPAPQTREDGREEK